MSWRTLGRPLGSEELCGISRARVKAIPQTLFPAPGTLTRIEFDSWEE